MGLWDNIFMNKGSGKKSSLKILPEGMHIPFWTVVSITLGVLLFAVDQRFKDRIEEDEGSFPRDMEGKAGRYLRFDRYHNSGFSLGWLKERPDVVIHSTLVGMSAVLAAFIRSALDKKSISEQLGLGLIFSGAASNLYDRLSRGYVVDFLTLKFGALKRLIINLGDAAIALGSMLYVFGVIFSRKDR